MQGVAKTIQKFLMKQKGKCLIDENFKFHGEHTYQVNDLNIDAEDGEILFYDSDNIIQEDNRSVIKHFLEDSVIEINISNKVMTINFGCGLVTIEAI